MTFNIGSTTHANSGSNIIGFNFGEKEHEGRYSTLKTIVINKLKAHFQDTDERSTIAHKWIPKDDKEQIITSIVSKPHHSSRKDYNIKVQAHIQRKEQIQNILVKLSTST